MAKVTGGIYIPHLKNEIIQPALDYLGLGGARAINQVTGTFLAEGYAGGFTYLKQLGKGPAVGAMQMEPFTYNDIWKNFLLTPKRNHLANLLKNIAGTFNADSAGIPKPNTLTGDIFFAAAMCRIFYLRVPTALPLASDASGMAQYHKKYYNTSLGKAVWQDNVDRFQQAIDA
ncbi:unnamed protein product [Commensalibacter communis]|uniref:Uncharacterized protein n=1 Tax=Commensalibacter communis TaxID=2972786 RepID=A0A9W4XIF6_9PROT|nr:hypothetical protein [Commensalibacter communis]CAI3948258.1 unnamed protein product [Commensalibacter communis]CAI3951454.1 unnamed protein product [Commensalibacter communis]CAI3951542.1 unnamed protein product [Commensalibacter communis]CAI3952587.1 unnamed protein product [Commensalibacter communis]CAI3953202.1 unnamed protein product [Commensalibacter communis]